MDRTNEVVARVQKQLERDGRTWMKLKTMVTAAGQAKASQKLLVEIEQAFEKAGIYHSPGDLQTCPVLGTVFISTQPFYDRGLPFESERHLSEFIARHYRQLEPFRRCTSVKSEFRVDGLRVDLLFREADGDLIACELEHGTGKHEAGSQVIGYVKAVRGWAETQSPGAVVRGMVISGAPNPRQEALCRTSGEDITWYHYRLALELTPSR